MTGLLLMMGTESDFSIVASTATVENSGGPILVSAGRWRGLNPAPKGVDGPTPRESSQTRLLPNPALDTTVVNCILCSESTWIGRWGSSQRQVFMVDNTRESSFVKCSRCNSFFGSNCKSNLQHRLLTFSSRILQVRKQKKSKPKSW